MDKASPVPIVIIFGPTAVGKTKLLLELFQAGVEIISADSMQVYRYLNIGTAKPTAQVLKQLPHHLIDIVDPDYQFNAGEFVHRADLLIEKIYRRCKVPVLAGGTAFYLHNFIYGLPESPVGDLQLRSGLKRLLKERGLPHLVQELRRVDPVSAEAIDQNDSYRVIRALEVYRASGKPLSFYKVPEKPRKDYEYLLIGLFRERNQLYQRINRRVDSMFGCGLPEEFRALLRMGYGEDDPGMRGIGYREFFELEKGRKSMAEVNERIKRNSRRYAKRQITFFRSLPDVQWFNPEELTAIRSCIDKFMNHLTPMPLSCIINLPPADNP